MTPAILSAILALSAAPLSNDPWVLAVGVNESGADDLAPLAYADDDAVAVVELLQGSSGRRILHTTMDAETQMRVPHLAAEARAPTRAGLLESVQEMARAMTKARMNGARPEVWVWFSGHAAYDRHGHPYYPLSDGPLHARTFVDEVVAPLAAAAHRVHIVLDTCFAGALVRARAKVERTTPRDVQQAFGAEGIRRFSNVGALVGASAGTQAFEWTDIRAGVFSAMVRAGLRGAADVDGDGQVRYRELAAFLAAASYNVPMKAAQPHFSVYPPAVDQNAVLMKRAWLGDIVTLRSDLSPFGAVQILDGSGAFLVAATFEPGFAPTLWLPRGRPLYLRARGADHALVVGEDGLQVGDAVPAEIASRSLVGTALRSGLFKARFGPAFYSGFAAKTSLAPPPPAPRPVPERSSGVSEAGAWGTSQYAGVGFMLVGTLVAGVAITSATFTAVSLVRYASTDLERSALIHITNGAITGAVSLGAFAVSALMMVIGARVFTFVDE